MNQRIPLIAAQKGSLLRFLPKPVLGVNGVCWTGNVTWFWLRVCAQVPADCKVFMGYDEELMEMMKVQLPWRIINLREKHGLSQQTLARKAHLAPSTISQLERGITWNVRVKTLAKLAGFFQVTFDYMAGIDQAPLVRARVIPGRPCPICGIGPAGHASGDCMIDMHASGRSFKFIAAAYGLTVKGIELLLREEYKLRRGRAKGTGQS